jgi:hypothetical protein
MTTLSLVPGPNTGLISAIRNLLYPLCGGSMMEFGCFGVCRRGRAPGVGTEIRKSEEDEAAKRTKNAAHENAYKRAAIRVSARFCAD